jgi:hypothetical protein
MSLYPLKHKYEGKEVERGVMRDTTSSMEETDRKLLALMVSMKCMLIFPV